jgi:putative ABC transport system substrate-binding protein
VRQFRIWPTAVFIAALALGILTAPLAAHGQQAEKVPRIGVVLHGGPYYAVLDGLRDGLRAVGLEDGQRVALVVRDAKGDVKAAEAAAHALEQERVSLIVSITTSVSLAVKRATAQVPIVFVAGTDPVAAGLVQSIAKPGGRLTGVHFLSTDLTAKRLEILKELLPRLHRVLTFYNPNNPGARVAARLAREAGQKLRVEVVERPVPSVEALRAAVRGFTAERGDAYFFLADAMVISQAQLIIDAATALRLPTMAQDPELAGKGVLVCYGVSYREVGREAATYVQRILASTSPRDLPVQAVDRLTLVVNFKTAKALGVTVPQSILVRVDQAIQ